MSQYQNGDYEKNKNAWQDEISERIMDRYLVNKVYPEFVKAGLIVAIVSVTDEELQKNGVDAFWETESGEQIAVDNKHRLSALNQTSRAVPCELITNERDGSNRHDGWLIQLSQLLYRDRAHLTDYILFTHPYTANRKETDFNKVKYEDIKAVDMLMVRVDELFEYLYKYYNLSMEDIKNTAWAFDKDFMEKTEGLSEDELANVSRKCVTGFERGIRDCISRKGESYITYDAVIHTSARTYMKEDPVNLLVREDVCKIFPHTRHFHYDVYDGLSEFYDIKERRAFSKKEEKIEY